MSNVKEIVKFRITEVRKLAEKLGTSGSGSIINKCATIYYTDSDMDWSEQKAIALDNGWQSTPYSAYLPDDFGYVSSLDMEDAGILGEQVVGGLFSKINL